MWCEAPRPVPGRARRSLGLGGRPCRDRWFGACHCPSGRPAGSPESGPPGLSGSRTSRQLKDVLTAQCEAGGPHTIPLTASTLRNSPTGFSLRVARLDRGTLSSGIRAGNRLPQHLGIPRRTCSWQGRAVPWEDPRSDPDMPLDAGARKPGGNCDKDVLVVHSMRDTRGHTGHRGAYHDMHVSIQAQETRPRGETRSSRAPDLHLYLRHLKATVRLAVAGFPAQGRLRDPPDRGTGPSPVAHGPPPCSSRPVTC